MAPKYQDNLAYDFALFEEKKVAPKKKEEEKKEEAVYRSRNFLKVLKIFMAIAVCGLLAGGLLYSNAVLAELNSESIALTKELDNLKDEEQRLKVELDSRINMKEVEEYITNELGMVKLEKYQVNYINLSDGDSMKVVAEDEGGLWDRICSFFTGIKEYFS